MGSYKIEFVRSAKREFERLPHPIQNKITEALFMLAQNPFSELLRVKKIKGADNLYRLRVGDYRIVYEVRTHILVVIVIKIGHRKDVYRNL